MVTIKPATDARAFKPASRLANGFLKSKQTGDFNLT